MGGWLPKKVIRQAGIRNGENSGGVWQTYSALKKSTLA